MKRTLIALALAAALPFAALADEPMSREFKLPLQARLPSRRAAWTDAANAWAGAFAAMVQKTNGVTIKGAAEFDKEREVRFLDTPGNCTLRAGGYILRERVIRQDYRLTLKTRSKDEAWVRATSIDAPGAATKLEEDVSPPADGKLSRVGDAAARPAAGAEDAGAGGRTVPGAQAAGGQRCAAAGASKACASRRWSTSCPAGRSAAPRSSPG